MVMCTGRMAIIMTTMMTMATNSVRYSFNSRPLRKTGSARPAARVVRRSACAQGSSEIVTGVGELMSTAKLDTPSRRLA